VTHQTKQSIERSNIEKPHCHILSFDVEEYFQVEAVAENISHAEWNSFEKRLVPMVELILQLLNEYNASATFFVLGWVARHEREVVNMIANAGHEIASHGMSHSMIKELTLQQFRCELEDSRKILEDISGQPVIGFRAPTFSITHQTAWAIDALSEAGYEYDSSIFPIHHDRYGVPDAPGYVHYAIGPAGGRVLEIPPLTVRLWRRNLPIGGGGYLRILPVRLIITALNGAEKNGQCGMIYLHPWEFDYAQPLLPMSRLNQWRHRVNLRRTEGKLRKLLEHFNFVSVSRVLNTLKVETGTYHYGLRPKKTND